MPFEGDGIEKVKQKIIDFDNMDNFQNEFKGVHKVRKIKVEYNIIISVARFEFDIPLSFNHFWGWVRGVTLF